MIAKGGSSASKLYLGSTEVAKMYKGDVLVYGSVSPIDGYQISKVRMPMYSYLDTGYYPNNTTRVEFGFTPLSKGRYSTIFIGKNASNVSQFSLQYGSTVNNLHAYCGTNISSSVSDKSVDLRPMTHYDISFSDAALVVNGTSYTYGVDQTFSSSNTLCINTDAMTSGYESESTFDYFKIYDNEILVRDYVPWKRANGTVGMLDRVNDVFYGSATNVAFTDDSVTLPNGYTRLNYIVCTGEQRFNTGFIPTNLTNYIIKYMHTGTAKSWQNILSSKVSNSSQRFELGNGNTTTANSVIVFGYNNGSVNPSLKHGNAELSCIKSDSYIYIYKDGSYATSSSRPRATFTAPTELTVGCANVNGTTYSNWFIGNIYEIDFFNEAHFIPCVNPSNVVGMYDIINGVFKSSETETEFVAGTVYGS